MHKQSEPEAPVSLLARRPPGGRGPVVAIVTGASGTRCVASTRSLRESTVCAQETFWLTTAEGAYQ